MSRPDENKNEHPVVHPIPPVYRADSRILILGSFPSVKSRETGFFYGHPQNRFWKVTAGHSGMRRYPADLLQRGDRVEVLPEVPGEAAGTGSGSSSVDESRERRMVCGAAAWRVEPVRRSLTKRRVTG